VAGDTLYGAAAAARIFLHAHRIGFVTPATGERVSVEAPLPEELQQWLAGLRII
jgi:23S rRNA-/tRNA-specific pseudouridylate synthase